MRLGTSGNMSSLVSSALMSSMQLGAASNVHRVSSSRGPWEMKVAVDKSAWRTDEEFRRERLSSVNVHVSNECQQMVDVIKISRLSRYVYSHRLFKPICCKLERGCNTDNVPALRQLALKDEYGFVIHLESRLHLTSGFNLLTLMYSIHHACLFSLPERLKADSTMKQIHLPEPPILLESNIAYQVV
nr:hypothetical protein [Tanacetum cinerariifolium]